MRAAALLVAALAAAAAATAAAATPPRTAARHLLDGRPAWMDVEHAHSMKEIERRAAAKAAAELAGPPPAGHALSAQLLLPPAPVPGGAAPAGGFGGHGAPGSYGYGHYGRYGYGGAGRAGRGVPALLVRRRRTALRPGSAKRERARGRWGAAGAARRPAWCPLPLGMWCTVPQSR